MEGCEAILLETHSIVSQIVAILVALAISSWVAGLTARLTGPCSYNLKICPPMELTRLQPLERDQSSVSVLARHWPALAGNNSCPQRRDHSRIPKQHTSRRQMHTLPIVEVKRDACSTGGGGHMGAHAAVFRESGSDAPAAATVQLKMEDILTVGDGGGPSTYLYRTHGRPQQPRPSADVYRVTTPELPCTNRYLNNDQLPLAGRRWRFRRRAWQSTDGHAESSHLLIRKGGEIDPTQPASILVYTVRSIRKQTITRFEPVGQQRLELLLAHWPVPTLHTITSSHPAPHHNARCVLNTKANVSRKCQVPFARVRPQRDVVLAESVAQIKTDLANSPPLSALAT
ncbi:hypothetical protein F5144DRAFT_256010 [Chaetomium tenue]|uniref:Uncharacterized protein n=1 Tax=Chaetomium tenue TaxID=1854479 RepID=A0ACB7PAV9_9PEZI|nr:hypothetical protein F5144DRAFT_256010 [Chaetomium globosum]